jgi:hypothetical protein
MKLKNLPLFRSRVVHLSYHSQGSFSARSFPALDFKTLSFCEYDEYALFEYLGLLSLSLPTN